jgi:hypothetical protein
MAKTPFIRPLQVQGGTFYTFSSSAEDLSFTFNNSVNKFRFSKFALLNLPDINNTSNGSEDNFIRLNGPDGAFLDWANATGNIITGDGNIDFSQSFQSYCLNLESTITATDEYDSTLKQNISERIFFKWLRELGAIRFRGADSNEVVPTLDQTTVTTVDGLPVTQKRYAEGDAVAGTTGAYGMTGGYYNRVVQYVGNLDIVNSVKNSTNTYSEVYVYVPTKDGNTPYVLFKNIADKNYYPDYQWTNNPNNPLNDEYLVGRNYDETNPSGLTNLAIFDDDVLGVPTASYIDTGVSASSIAGNWYSPRDTANTYFTDSSFVDPSNYILTKTDNSNSLTYIRSKLDSIGIDFNPNSYQGIISDPSISTLEEFNSTAGASDFEFNAVLIYYDVYDPAIPTDVATNLYGVLFLDDVNTSSGDIFIPRLSKHRPNPVTKLNGNSYGFKINLKFDTDIDQTGVEQAINDYSPFSLSMFMDAMNVLQDASATLNNASVDFINLSDRVTNLENITLSSQTAANLDRRITGLEQTLAANQALFNNTSSIMGLINQNYDMVRAIINNQTSVEVSYNLDLFKQGSGISLDRSTPNEVTVNSINQDFTIGNDMGKGTLTQNGNNEINLLRFSNYFKHVNNGNPLTLTGDLTIRINDDPANWKNGQRFRLSFGDIVYPGQYFINVLTNSQGRYPISNPSTVSYSTSIITLDNDIFETQGYKPVLDIVCIDENNLEFQVDIIGRSLTNN